MSTTQQNTPSTEVLDLRSHLKTTLDFSPKAHIHTFGCAGNISDSERIAGVLAECGYSLTDTLSEADVVIYNTCAVREHAQTKVFGNVGELKHLKAKNSNALVILMGCMVQQEAVAEKIKKSYPFVDIVLGTNLIHTLPENILQCLTDRHHIVHLDGSDEIIEGLPLHREDSYKGNLSIMYGCNNYCTYCIVPYVRGRERSRDLSEILAEANEMIDSGYKEITLLGQNVNSYASKNGETFVDLLREVCKIKGDFLVRFMTSHPKDCTHELIDFIANELKMARQLHLPVQSGSDTILSAMNRQYTVKSYLELIAYAKKQIPDISFSSDIIVGFPGETRSDFDDTLSLIKAVGFKQLYTFIYSKRAGTKAAELPDKVEAKEKSNWLRELLSVEEEISERLSKAMLKKTYRILVEGQATQDGYLLGKTQSNMTVSFKSEKALIGTFQNVNITNATAWWLTGEAN